jgi:hypothetical protein
LFLYGEAGGFFAFLGQFSRSKKFFSNFFSEKGRFWVCILPPFVQMSEGVIFPQGISPFKVP